MPIIVNEEKTIQRQVAKRWTPELSKAWTPVSDAFLTYYRELDITPPEAMFIILLMSYKWDKSAPYPGFKSLAKKMGVTMTAVRGYARSLEKDKKVLRREIRVDDTNIFHLDLLFEKLEQKVKAAEAKDGIKTRRVRKPQAGRVD